MEIDRLPEDGLSDGTFFESLRRITIAETKALIYRAEETLEGADLLVQVPERDTFVVGDMHGDISACFSIVTRFLDEKTPANCMFLGDYVDRGPHQVDVINMVLLLKMQHPDRVHLLRGNHEVPAVNEQMGFKQNLTRQFGYEDGRILWHLYNRLFTHFPLAAITWNRIFLVHGGIPEALDSIESIKRFPREFNIEHQPTIELLWNDPVDSKRHPSFEKSGRGGTVKKFGQDAFDAFVSKHRISAMVRAHEEHNDGFKEYFDGRLLSIFSARRELVNPFERQIKPKVLRIPVGGTWHIEDVERFELA